MQGASGRHADGESFMNLGGYRLLAQRGAGSDGVAYRAQVLADARPVEVCILSQARAAPERWASLVKRLRLAAMLAHPVALQIHGLGLEHDPPYVALDWRCFTRPRPRYAWGSTFPAFSPTPERTAPPGLAFAVSAAPSWPPRPTTPWTIKAPASIGRRSYRPWPAAAN